MTIAGKPSRPVALMFADDGVIPNNPVLPMLIYRGAIELDGIADPESALEAMFAANGWGRDMWRDGIFPYVHYHSMIHEALGIARGHARVRFGGAQGEELEVKPGDVVVLPAGTGHQRLFGSEDFRVVGAYPLDGTYNLCRGTRIEHDKAMQTISRVPVPDTDPVAGGHGPLPKLWRI
jgi:uncharacterized protein YjlB